MNVTYNQSEQVLVSAIAKAKELGTAMNIAIVDEGANLKSFCRMDDAFLGGADLAIKKAQTSRFFNAGSGEIGKMSQPGGSLYNIEHSNGGLVTFAGGLLLKDSNSKIIGAIGVSGGTVEQDHDVAVAGANALARP